MKYILLLFLTILFVILFLCPAFLCGGVFDSPFKKGLENMTREDLIELAVTQNNNYISLKKAYNKLHVDYVKYFQAYKKNNKLPIWFINKHFSLQAGLSGYLDIDNPLRSNIDFIFQGSFYNKWLMFTIGMQPINLNIFVMAGVFFPY